MKVRKEIKVSILVIFSLITLILGIFLTHTLTHTTKINSSDSVVKFEPKETELTLNQIPDFFKEEVIIIVGKQATAIENQCALALISDLEESTPSKPIIKKDCEILEAEMKTHNLILIGSKDTNEMFQQLYKQLYNLKTDAAHLSDEFPGSNEGFLEILRSPWNRCKAVLLVGGSDEWGVKVASSMLIDKKFELHGKTKVTGAPLVLEGRVVLVGNEPFAELGIETVENTYGLIGENAKELSTVQGSKVEIKGILRGGTVRFKESIEVMEFNILKE